VSLWLWSRHSCCVVVSREGAGDAPSEQDCMWARIVASSANFMDSLPEVSSLRIQNVMLAALEGLRAPSTSGKPCHITALAAA
jgi:hypothetical protein